MMRSEIDQRIVEKSNMLRNWWEDRDITNTLIKMKRVSRRAVKFIKDIIPILENVYPSLWDIQFFPYSGNYQGISFRETEKRYSFSTSDVRFVTYLPNIVIHFPYSKMTNMNNQTHEIYDIYVRIPIESSGRSIMITRILGLRQSYSYAEAISNYRFSHLTSRSVSEPPVYDSFCLGSGEINQCMAMFNSTQNLATFKHFLFYIESYLAYESIEGVPYEKFEKISSFRGARFTDIPNYDLITVYKTITQNIPLYKQEYPFDLRLTSSNGKIKIGDMVHFEKIVNRIINMAIRNGGVPRHFPSEQLIFMFKLPDGSRTDASTDVTPSGDIIFNDEHFYFRGEKRIMKIVGHAVDYSRIRIYEQRVVKPKVLNYVKERIEHKLNYTFTARNITERINQSSSS